MLRRTAAVVICAWALAVSATAQEFRGTITGRVTDTQSAALPNAKITATLVSTGAHSTTNSGADGLYTIPFLSPGAYRIEVEAPGFKCYVQENFEVAAGERVGLDVQLQLGQINETITVTAEAPMLDTTTAT